MPQKIKKGFFKKKIKDSSLLRRTRKTVSSSNDVEKSLEAIYKDDSGKMPDLTKIEPARSKWWALAISAAIIFFVGAAAALAAFFFFVKPFRGFSGNALRIMVQGPEQVTIGREATYFINYQNISGEPLAQTELRITFPTDFIPSSVEPEPTTGKETWKLGSLAVEERGTVTVRGVFTGAIGTQSAIQIVGTYRPASFNSDFETLTTHLLTYSASVLEGELSAPQKVLPGDELVLAYTLQNAGEEDLDGLVARMELPEGFDLSQSTSGTVSGTVLELDVGSLASGASTTLEIVGSFSAGVSGDMAFAVETGRLDADRFLPALRTETRVVVLAGNLLLELLVNGQDRELKTPYEGLLRFAVRYENTSSEELQDVELRFILESAKEDCVVNCTVDWDSYSDSASGTPRNNEVVWSPDGLEDLERLLPREDGEIDISLSGLPVKYGESGLAFRAYLEAEIGRLGDEKVNRVVRSSPILIRYVTDAAFSSSARYFLDEGAPIGSGPLPPVAGSSTTYRIEWKISKSLHELQNITVRAPVSKIASWAGNTVVNAGQLQYDEAKQEVQWTLNRVPEDVDEVSVAFDLTIVPGDADVGRFADILGEASLEAEDVNAEYDLFQTRGKITTDLREDEYAEGKGVVRAAE